MNKLVRQLLCVSMLVLCNNYADAQNCKYVKITEDPFAKAPVRNASVFIPQGWQITMQRKDGQYYLGLNMRANGAKRTVIAAGEKILFKLGDKEIYELVMDKDYEPLFFSSGVAVATNWKVLVPISVADFQKFANLPITAVRITINGEDNLLKLNEKPGRDIMDTFICMMQDSK